MTNPRYDGDSDPRRDPKKQGENTRPGQGEQQQQGGHLPDEQGNPNVRKPGQKDESRNDQQR